MHRLDCMNNINRMSRFDCMQPIQHTTLLGSSLKTLSLPKIMVAEAEGTGERCGCSIFLLLRMFFLRSCKWDTIHN
jgi:hypothetical protein